MIGNLQSPPPRLAPGSFHHVMTNPPYQAVEDGRASPNPIKAAANQEGGVDLMAWMRFSVNMLQPKGSLVVVYRADRLDDLAGGAAGAGRRGRHLSAVAESRAPGQAHPAAGPQGRRLAADIDAGHGAA